MSYQSGQIQGAEYDKPIKGIRYDLPVNDVRHVLLAVGRTLAASAAKRSFELKHAD